MGLIEMSYSRHLGENSTKCMTINDVYMSHMERSQIVMVELNDIYGMLVLFGLGVAGAFVIFIAETGALVLGKQIDVCWLV